MEIPVTIDGEQRIAVMVEKDRHRLMAEITWMAHRWFLEPQRSKSSDTRQYRALVAALREWREPLEEVPERHRCCVRDE